jgi:hypothetical protein
MSVATLTPRSLGKPVPTMQAEIARFKLSNYPATITS